MKDIVSILENSLRDSLSRLNIDHDSEILIEHPNDLTFGDYSTNIALVISKKEGKSPKDIAELLVQELKQLTILEISEISIAGAGFINFTLSKEYLASVLTTINQEKENYGKNDSFSGKNVLVEHSSPNIFKPFHIGHLMNNTVGESLSRLYNFSGAEVTTISYPSDVSLGIGKAVWKLLEYGIEKIDSFESEEEKVTFLGQCYSEGTSDYSKNPDIEPRIREITQDIYEHKDTEAYRAYIIGRDLNLDYFKKSTQRLGSSFDGYIFESEAGIEGKKIVTNNTPSVYTESEGAVVYNGEEEGLHTRVFINKDQNPTYEAKDTGLLKLKQDRYPSDISVLVTDEQQGPYYQVVLAAANKINPLWKEQTKHVMHGRMTFKGEAMSSRLGNTPRVAEILKVVNQEVLSRTKNSEISNKESDSIAIAALKYTILRTQVGKSINFIPETSLSFEGDSGPYIQYTHARCKSLLRKAVDLGIVAESNVPKDWEATDIERFIYRFPEVIKLATDNQHPHMVVSYITELSQLFNSWYGSTKILDKDDPQKGYKLSLCDAVAHTIANALYVLGISAPEKM